jgi:hypothetical protein
MPGCANAAVCPTAEEVEPSWLIDHHTRKRENRFALLWHSQTVPLVAKKHHGTLAILKSNLDELTELIGAADKLVFRITKLVGKVLLLIWLLKNR